MKCILGIAIALLSFGGGYVFGTMRLMPRAAEATRMRDDLRTLTQYAQGADKAELAGAILEMDKRWSRPPR